MELNAGLKRMIETGRVDFGTEKTMKHLMAGDAKLVVIASNCPKKARTELEKRSKIENIPIMRYSGTSLQLGEVCGKPFVVASLSVLDSGSVPIEELKA